jgi:parallel beta-helix repeat protein
MRPLLAISALFFAAAASGSVGISSAKPSYGATVSAGSLVDYRFIPFVNEVDEHDVVVDFTAAPATIESASSAVFQCTVAGSTARCTRSLFPKNSQTEIALNVRMPPGPTGGHVYVTGTIQAASGATNSWRTDVVVPNLFPVTNSNPSGPGSLSEAITEANAACQGALPCEIDFNIDGPTTIAPESAFPTITASKLDIDGRKQIVLDGSRAPSSAGLTLLSSSEVTIHGLTLTNWGGPGIQLLGSRSRSYRATIFNNQLGPGNLRGIMSNDYPFLYLHDNVISGNKYSGVWIWSGDYPAVYDNKIESNGASGVYVGPGVRFGMADENVIRGNRDFGVAVDPQARWIEVRANSMKGNGQLGIDYGLDLVTPNVADDSTRSFPNAPVLTSATYDPAVNQTVIIGHVDLRKPADVGYYLPLVDVYRSSALDAHGMAQGEEELFGRQDYGSGVRINSFTGDFVYTHSGDLTGQYITATYTRMYALGKGNVTVNTLQPRPEYYENWQATSEFSNPMRVGR